MGPEARFSQIRAGTGGDEAGLWAADLLRMYQRYSDNQRWKASIVSENTAEAGGFKEVVIQVRAPFPRGRWPDYFHDPEYTRCRPLSPATVTMRPISVL